MYGICSVLLLHFFTVLSSAGENIDQYTKYFTRMNFTPTAKKVCKVCSLIILLYALESNLFFFAKKFPIGSMGLEYLPIFSIDVSQM